MADPLAELLKTAPHSELRKLSTGLCCRCGLGAVMGAVMGAEGVAATQGLDWREEPGEPPPPLSRAIWLLEVPVLVSVEPCGDPSTPPEPGGGPFTPPELGGDPFTPPELGE